MAPTRIVKSLSKSWSRLIQKAYSRDSLICPKCSGKMKVIARFYGHRWFYYAKNGAY